MLASGIFGYIGDYLLWWVLYASLLIHSWCFFKCFPRAKRRVGGLILGNALVLLCMLGTLGIVGETYYRFICVETDSFGLSLPAKRWFNLYDKRNPLGCRDPEWQAVKPPGVKRIAFVGDSLTYGWGIERTADRFSDRIQARFDERGGDRVEVMNVAKPGWSTGDQLQPIKDMIAVYGVDEIVLCHLPNDIEPLVPRTAQFDPLRPPRRRWFSPHLSALLDYLSRRLIVPRADTVVGYFDWLAAGFANASIWSNHQEQLFAIIQYCRQRNVTLRVALMPYIQTRGPAFKPTAIQAQLREFLTAHGIGVVDLLPTIEGLDPADLVVNKVDPHPNEQAHARFADAIWKAFYAQ